MMALGSSFLDISSTDARTRHCNPCSISMMLSSTDNKIMLSWLDDVTLRNKSIVGEQMGLEVMETVLKSKTEGSQLTLT